MITREFVLAGRAIFTVANGRGEHYTFKVTSLGDSGFRVGWLTGSDNSNDYTAIGKMSCDGIGSMNVFPLARFTTAVNVYLWAIRKIWHQADLPAGYSIIHAGRCGRCGRLLTTPESVESGFGPKCQEKVS